LNREQTARLSKTISATRQKVFPSEKDA
jgi:hypothetical protein